jgi:hypothetical protein
MAEAQKMMGSPEYQKQMKKLGNSKEYKDSIKKTTDLMKDPSAAAQAEAKFEHMVKVGQAEHKKAAGDVMEDAMAAMANPEVMAEMANMIKDPNFQQQLADMAKDPSFASYVEAVSRRKQSMFPDRRRRLSKLSLVLFLHFQMQDMMKDPTKKKKMEMLGDTVRAGL